MAKGIRDVHISNTSILAYNDKNALSCVIMLAYYNAVIEYTGVGERPTGMGYAEVVFLPRKGSYKPAMIVELKYGKSTGEALRQIRESR